LLQVVLRTDREPFAGKNSSMGLVYDFLPDFQRAHGSGERIQGLHNQLDLVFKVCILVIDKNINSLEDIQGLRDRRPFYKQTTDVSSESAPDFPQIRDQL